MTLSGEFNVAFNIILPSLGLALLDVDLGTVLLIGDWVNEFELLTESLEPFVTLFPLAF